MTWTPHEREIFQQTLQIAKKLELLTMMGKHHTVSIVGNRMRLLDHKRRIVWAGEGQFVLNELRKTLDRRIAQI